MWDDVSVQMSIRTEKTVPCLSLNSVSFGGEAGTKTATEVSSGPNLMLFL